MSDDTPSDDARVGGGRALGAGLVGFVTVHLLALLVVGEPSLPSLLGIEAVAVGLLLVGDALATDARATLPVAVGVGVALGAVRLALDPAGMPPWVVAVGLLVVAGTVLYTVHRYDRFLAGGEPA
ncbi:hypothetical protein ACFQE8_08890 [Salinirubellus sp. GCM10025818]|uniref:hypothetical protein n=1 Tax=Salinirubellus TaxID=2162630 RepID=UPI0030D4BDAB